jgi:hypothetical protein
MVVRWQVWPLGWLENLQGVFPRNNLTVLESGKLYETATTPLILRKYLFPELELKLYERKVLPSNQSSKRPQSHAHGLNKFTTKRLACIP